MAYGKREKTVSTVYVMRHGDAVSRANTDAERPLSERGIAEAESMVDTLLAEPPGLIWVSPCLFSCIWVDLGKPLLVFLHLD